MLLFRLMYILRDDVAVIPVPESSSSEVKRCGHSISRVTHNSLKALNPFWEKISTIASPLAEQLASEVKRRSSSEVNTPFCINCSITAEDSISLERSSLCRSKSRPMDLEPGIFSVYTPTEHDTVRFIRLAFNVFE